MAVIKARNFTESSPVGSGTTGTAHGPGSAHASLLPTQKTPYMVGGSYNRNVVVTIVDTANHQAPPLGTPTGGTARIRTSDTNQGWIVFAESQAALDKGQGEVLTAGKEIIFPFRIGRLFYRGNTVNDTALISVRSQ